MVSQSGQQNCDMTWSWDHKYTRGSKKMLHVTDGVATWDALLSIKLIGGLKGGINLHEVKTGEARVALWHPSGQQRPQGETNTHPPPHPFPFSCLHFYPLSLWGPLPACPVPCPPPWPLNRPNVGHLFIDKRRGDLSSLVLRRAASLEVRV